ncbi:Rod shape-determining protein MreC [hydrothermal vent metagenome]|uniref:Cell shape-determining protein MreC n=1 Tax=hydrothermal vent metagenome TaxID=652676 RepID=A0A3B0ZHV6_9ZZZZ
MIFDHRYDHLDNIRSGIATALYPIQYITNIPSVATYWVSDTFVSRENLLKENSNLKTEHLLLKAQLQKLYALERENIRLRGLMGSTQDIGERMMISEIIAVDLAPFSRQIVINKGGSDKLFTGQPLLDAKGVVGQVIEVGKFSSRAMMITDPSHAIPVQVNRTGMRAIAVGTGDANNGLELTHIPNNADIQKGDLLVTSGLGGRFPAGYPVAHITEIILDPHQSYAVVKAQPAAALERIREILVIWKNEPDVVTGEPVP